MTTGVDGPGGGVPPAVSGLAAAEVEARRDAGLVNEVDRSSSRSVGDILRANILTRFNAIISILLVVVIVFGDLRDALFGVVMVVNAVIGIVQELRAKRTLDRLAVLVAPRADAIRDGVTVDVDATALVLDDVVRLKLGDQVPVDGSILTSEGLQVDESLLTGEADPVSKIAEDAVFSGSFVVAGSAIVRATAVGPDAYANRLAAEAKEFALTRSELGVAIDRILRIVTWLLIPVSALLIWSQLTSGESLSDAMVATVAGVVAMVPQGLVLLVSMAFAVAVVRLGRKNVLVQELPAVETLARVDTLCVDKTGTLTRGVISLERSVPLPGAPEDLNTAFAAMAASDAHPNPTLAAIAEVYHRDPGWQLDASIPFSSDRKLSAFTFRDHGTWVMGAPEILGSLIGLGSSLSADLGDLAATGRRVLLVAHAAAPLRGDSLPSGLAPVAYLTLAEEVRPDAGETVAYFTAQHVDLKVISGDNRRTVAAIAATVGVPGFERSADARDLPREPAELGAALEASTVFGRVNPEQKRDMVDALQNSGHTVAMTGDGVNDVLALKHADIGIAMGSGAPATKGVAQLVLLDNRFETLPSVVAEGRRVIANMERVAALFVTKTVYATILAVLIGFAGLPFPFLPRHLTLIGSLTIGIPAFFLSFEPTSEPVQAGFLGRVMRFAVPSGAVAALAAFEVYGISRFNLVEADLVEARTAATITMVLFGLWIVVELIEPLDRWRRLLVGSMLAVFVLILALPAGRAFFELAIPRPEIWAAIFIVVVTAAVVLHMILGAIEDASDRRTARRASRSRAP